MFGTFAGQMRHLPSCEIVGFLGGNPRVPGSKPSGRVSRKSSPRMSVRVGGNFFCSVDLVQMTSSDLSQALTEN